MCAGNDFRSNSSDTRNTTNIAHMRTVGVVGRAQGHRRPRPTGSSGLICFNMTCRMNFRDIPW